MEEQHVDQDFESVKRVRVSLDWPWKPRLYHHAFVPPENIKPAYELAMAAAKARKPCRGYWIHTGWREVDRDFLIPTYVISIEKMKTLGAREALHRWHEARRLLLANKRSVCSVEKLAAVWTENLLLDRLMRDIERLESKRIELDAENAAIFDAPDPNWKPPPTPKQKRAARRHNRLTEISP